MGPSMRTIEQLEGFEVNNKDIRVWRLKKALYGLKQSPRAWYAIMDAYLLRIGFMKSLLIQISISRLWIMS